MSNWDLLEKSGKASGGWDYNENNLTYNQEIDIDTGNPVYYNSLGLVNSWSNINKT